MKYFLIFSLLLATFVSCQPEDKTAFTQEALTQIVYNEDVKETDIKTVLDAYKGKKVIIDVWASWCGDCIKGLSKINKFQEEHPEVEFVFISVDKTQGDWQAGVDKFFPKFKVKGSHYYLGDSKDNEFRKFLGLDWIPRYLLLDENGEILVYYAKSIEEKQLSEAL